MRLALPCFLALFFLASCADGKIPVITVDEAHFLVKRVDGSLPRYYSIPPSDSFILDYTSYEFVPGMGKGNPRPTALTIETISGRYRLELKGGNGRVTVQATALKVLEGRPILSFSAGMNLFIEVLGPSEMMWAGMVNVKN